jgi:hypothetical protein
MPIFINRSYYFYNLLILVFYIAYILLYRFSRTLYASFTRLVIKVISFYLDILSSLFGVLLRLSILLIKAKSSYF